MSFLRCSLHEPNEEMEITVKWFVGRQMLLSSPSCSNRHRFLVDSGFLFHNIFRFSFTKLFFRIFFNSTTNSFHISCCLRWSFFLLFSLSRLLFFFLQRLNCSWTLIMSYGWQERDDVCKSDVGKKYRCFGIQFWTIVLKVIIIFFTVHSFGMFTKCSVFLCNTVINWDIGRHQPTRWCNKINKKNESRKKERKNN